MGDSYFDLMPSLWMTTGGICLKQEEIRGERWKVVFFLFF